MLQAVLLLAVGCQLAGSGERDNLAMSFNTQAVRSRGPQNVARLSHVRSSDRRLLSSLQEGLERSPTFRQLVDRLDESDVIVYVEFGHCAFGHLAGCTLPFVGTGAAGHQRYLRVIVKPGLKRPRLIALIAHELRHAIEVSEAPEVIDAEGLFGLYRRIGVQICPEVKSECYETSEARRAGLAVRDELEVPLPNRTARREP